MELDVSLPCSQ